MMKQFKLNSGYVFNASKNDLNSEVWGALSLNGKLIECGYYRTDDFIKALNIALNNNNITL